MEYRFLLLLLLAFLTCASVQARRSSFSFSGRRTGSSKPSYTRTSSTSHTTHHNTGYGSSRGSMSHSLLLAEGGGHRRPTTGNQPISHPRPATSGHKESNYPRTTPHSIIRTTAAPSIQNTHQTYPAWGNPFYMPTQRPRNPVITNNNHNVHHSTVGSSRNHSIPLNTHGISVSPTTRSPFGTQNHGGSSYHVNRPNITNTVVRPSHHSPSIVNSTLARSPNVGAGVTSDIRPMHIQHNQGASIPSAPYPNPHIPNQPFHQTSVNPSQSMPIPNAPPYPLHPVHPTPVHPGNIIPHPNAPPYGSHPIQHTPIQPAAVGLSHTSMPHANSPYPMQSPHPGNVMYPNQHPYPQPHYPDAVSYPGGSYHGGVHPGSPVVVPHSGQAYYPQQAPIYHSAPSPTIVMMPNQQDNGRGVGQIFKEALIYSGVNAAVNRIINPSHYHHQYSADSGRPVASSQNTETTNTHSTTHTEITYNNQYINTVPGSNGIAPAQPGVAQPGVPAWSSLSGTPGGQAYQPGTMIPNQPVAPGIVGQPIVPGTATPTDSNIGQPVVSGTTNAQPAAPGTTIYQPGVSGTPSVGQPAVPGTPSVVQPVVPGTPSVGQPSVPVSTDSLQSGQTTVPDSSTTTANQPIVPVTTTSNPAASVNGTGSAPITNSSNPQETAVNTIQYRITDQELQSLSEDLFNKDEFNAYKYMTLNMQGHSTGPNVSDQAAGPLFQVMPIAYTIPTVQALRSLYEDYALDSQVKEIMTMETRKKENVLLDVFLNTNVMSITMNWLSKQGFVEDDDYEKKDMLNRIWFTQFDGTSSGFERVFVAELFNGADVLGVQDWVYFDYQESKNRINYLGYVDKLPFGDKAAMLKVDFRLDGVLRQNGTLFIGTSPELEMALYTICYYARPGDICPISLGGTKINLYTHPYRYLGKDMIDLALPIF